MSHPTEPGGSRSPQRVLVEANDSYEELRFLAWPPENPAPGAMKLEVEVVGDWNAIRFDVSGARLFATGREGKAELDLVNAALRCGDGPWQPLIVS